MARHADHDKRRAAFGEAAFNILASEGLAGLTVRSVAKAAGFTTGALVHYFPTKSDLFIAASEHAALIVRPRMERDEVEFPGLEGVRQVIHEALPRTPQIRALWSVWLVFWDRARIDPDIGKLAKLRYAEWHGRLARLFKRAQEVGEISSSFEPDVLARTATVLVDGIAVQALRTSMKLSPAQQTAIVDSWLQSLRGN